MRIKSLVAVVLAAAAVVPAVMVACSSNQSCKPGTLNLQVQLWGGAVYADSLVITSLDPPNLGVSMTVPRAQGVANNLFVDVAFPNGYPADKTVTFLVRAYAGGQVLGESNVVIHLDSGCSTGAVTIRAELLDAAPATD